jgi:hypothetical protein
VQDAGTTRHSTTGDVFTMQAGLVTPRGRVKKIQIFSLSKEIEEEGIVLTFF